MKTIFFVTLLSLSASVQVAMAQDQVELESIFIKGNKEFPQILYIVPWKDMKPEDHRGQTLVLHSLFGGLFDPVYDEVGTDLPILPSAK
jgi:uncharacterized membrane protein (UPF0127 family)